MSSPIEAAWLRGYTAARARIIATITADLGQPEVDKENQRLKEQLAARAFLRASVHAEAQDAADAGRDATVTMQVMLADACAQLAAAEAEIARLRGETL